MMKAMSIQLQIEVGALREWLDRNRGEWDHIAQAADVNRKALQRLANNADHIPSLYTYLGLKDEMLRRSKQRRRAC